MYNNRTKNLCFHFHFVKLHENHTRLSEFENWNRELWTAADKPGQCTWWSREYNIVINLLRLWTQRSRGATTSARDPRIKAAVCGILPVMVQQTREKPNKDVLGYLRWKIKYTHTLIHLKVTMYTVLQWCTAVHERCIYVQLQCASAYNTAYI